MNYYHSSYKTQRVKKKSPFKFFIYLFLFLIVISGSVAGYFAYQAVFAPNVWTQDEKDEYMYISNDFQFEDVTQQLYAKGMIIHRNNFEWLAKYKEYIGHIKPGRYTIKNGMSNNDLINLLRSGNQEPVKLKFNNIRLKEDLVRRVASQINIDTTLLIKQLNDSSYTKTLGFSTEDIKCMFLPNTYYVYWNTSTEQFLTRMHYEYNQFWTDENKAKAAQHQLTPVEVSILASIIDKETHKNDEKARIAGVYLNRLKNGWRLQADPTLIYAIGDFKIKRVLNVYKEIDSPYNTYMYLGLPPGPICIPSLSSINAVLNAEDHSYFFFCAKPDYSGYHNFAKYSRQHIKNANEYRAFLNREKIFK